MEAESFTTVSVDGAQIVCRRIGKGRALLILNGFAATSADWDPSFIDRLASSNELILLNNRGIGGSTDNGQAFDIAKLADDAAHVIETLGVERANGMEWSMDGLPMVLWPNIPRAIADLINCFLATQDRC